ncbi:MAG: hypothetical protein HC902_14125 [Calothrix sp. SM1_5_4]|nr:hypothetical protein [Calothrix sp. SM1_5_4]
MRAPADIPVREGPEPQRKILFYLNQGEALTVVADLGQVAKIRVRRRGKIRGGFVAWKDLKAPAKARLAAGWSWGMAGQYSTLTQKSNSFATEDQVTYNISSYASQAISGYVISQSARRNFWRFWLGARRNVFTGSARTDVAGAPSRRVQVEQMMVSLVTQKAWNTGWKPLYLGFGFEVARTMNQKVALDGVKLPGDDSELPLFIGLHAVTGVQFNMGSRLQPFFEARYVKFLNQPVSGFEGAAGLLYWY